MRAGQDDRARIGMTRAQIVQELLGPISSRIQIEHKQVRLGIEHNFLRFLQGMGAINGHSRSAFLQGIGDSGCQLVVRLYYQNASSVNARRIHSLPLQNVCRRSSRSSAVNRKALRRLASAEMQRFSLVWVAFLPALADATVDRDLIERGCLWESGLGVRPGSMLKVKPQQWLRDMSASGALFWQRAQRSRSTTCVHVCRPCFAGRWSKLP